MITLPFGNSALIVSKNKPGQFLAVCRRENPELVCFPGGKLEDGESSVEGMVREVYEETGLKVDAAKAIPIYSGVCEGKIEYWVTTYLIEVDGDEVLEPPEKDMFPHWVDKETFMKKTSYPIFNAEVFKSVEKFWK